MLRAYAVAEKYDGREHLVSVHRSQKRAERVAVEHALSALASFGHDALRAEHGEKPVRASEALEVLASAYDVRVYVVPLAPLPLAEVA